jgi:hypothetical protein
VEQVLAFLVQRRQATIEAVLVQFPAPRRPHMERGLVWMAKYGLVSILGRSNHIPI